MSSALHFSPIFKPRVSDIPPSPGKSSNKRKRGVELLEDNSSDGGEERIDADSTANGTSLPFEHPDSLVTVSLVAPDEKTLCKHNALRAQISDYTDHEESHITRKSRPISHLITETALSMPKRQISDELATLEPPLYIATGRLPTASVEKSTSSLGLRQHHLKIMIAVLHRSLLERNYIRAGRAWAMLLRAEQHGQSMDLRTGDRWGVGAEILMQRESQIAQETSDHKFGDSPKSNFSLYIKPENIDKVREYYERLLLQYPYRKAFPNALGALNFSVAMFSLWIYTVKEWSSVALMSVGSFNEDIDEAEAEANGNVRSSSAPAVEPYRYQKNENVQEDSLKIAYEIAARLDGLLVSPPYSDNAQLWKLCGEVSLWIADLSVPADVPTYGSNFRRVDGDLAMERPILSSTASKSTSPSENYGTGQERQTALAKAEKAFQRVKICGESLAE